MNNSKLFPNSERRRRQQQQQQRAQDLLNQIDRLARTPNEQTLPQIEARTRELTRLTSSGGFAREMVSSIRSLAKSISERPSGAIGSFLRTLGVSGNSIARWFRSYEGQQLLQPIRQQVQQAIGLANQLDPEAIGLGNQPPEQAGGQVVPTPPDRPVHATNRGRPPLPPDVPDYDPDPIHRNVTVLPDGRWRIRGPGYERIMRPEDDLLTGRMIPATSSNVHSYGYEFNLDAPLKGKLIVRYLQRDRSGRTNSKVGGPTYAYESVHPDLFNDLKLANSKGKWVWDDLRIRGTIAGHQFSYHLIRAAQDYLPRRAIVRNGQQILRRRRRTAEPRNGERYQLTSPLGTQRIGPYRPTSHRPNVGNPDRGRANIRR